MKRNIDNMENKMVEKKKRPIYEDAKKYCTNLLNPPKEGSSYKEINKIYLCRITGLGCIAKRSECNEKASGNNCYED